MCEEVNVDVSVTRDNDRIADENNRLLNSKRIFCVNIMGSPGAGKTTVIERMTAEMDKAEVLVIQGDLESDYDKKRIEAVGIECIQINTKSSCHLHANMIKDVLDNVNLDGKKYLIIENIGNLVCPVGVKLGQDLDILICSTVEGSDKPIKYPNAFRKANIIVITKYDLIEGFDEAEYFGQLSKLNRFAKVVKFSDKNPETYHDLTKTLRDAYNDHFHKSKDTCVHCDSPIPHDSKICHVCEKIPTHNKNVENRCPHCGALIKSDDTVCHSCLQELDRYKDTKVVEYSDRA